MNPKYSYLRNINWTIAEGDDCALLVPDNIRSDQKVHIFFWEENIDTRFVWVHNNSFSTYDVLTHPYVFTTRVHVSHNTTANCNTRLPSLKTSCMGVCVHNCCITKRVCTLTELRGVTHNTGPKMMRYHCTQVCAHWLHFEDNTQHRPKYDDISLHAEVCTLTFRRHTNTSNTSPQYVNIYQCTQSIVCCTAFSIQPPWTVGI